MQQEPALAAVHQETVSSKSIHFLKYYRNSVTTPDRRCRCCACHTSALHNHARCTSATSKQILSL